ncbi:unnamed protein product [Rangifer tarandus platyrhynchus]|uniref:Uncharacterized protein n=1 Tax=Rangifer tarandus platyrhynchus TaxID=3082113 RepID=A0AC59YFP7_RANTA
MTESGDPVLNPNAATWTRARGGGVRVPGHCMAAEGRLRTVRECAGSRRPRPPAPPAVPAQRAPRDHTAQKSLPV